MELVDVCVYCDKEVKDTDEKFCCMWIEYQTRTGSEDFTGKDFKNLVKHSYKVKNEKIEIGEVKYYEDDFDFDFLGDDVGIPAVPDLLQK